MSQTGPRPDDTETFKYWANALGNVTFSNGITLGTASIKFNGYTVNQQSGWLDGGQPNLLIFPPAGDNGDLTIVSSSVSGPGSNASVNVYNDPTNTAGQAMHFNISTGVNGAGQIYIEDFTAAPGQHFPLTIATVNKKWTLSDLNGSTSLPGMLINTAITDPSAAAGQLWLSSTNADTLKYSNASAIFNVVATRATSQQTSVTNAAPTTVSFTPPAETGIYRISGYLNVTTGTTIAAALKITYKDPEGNARNDGVVFQKAGSATLLTSVVTTGQQTFQETIAIDNSGTAITVANNAGTYTTCIYDLAVVIERLA